MMKSQVQLSYAFRAYINYPVYEIFLLEIEKTIKNFDNFSVFYKKFPKMDYY